jgi:hypothetical protein
MVDDVLLNKAASMERAVMRVRTVIHERLEDFLAFARFVLTVATPPPHAE